MINEVFAIRDLFPQLGLDSTEQLQKRRAAAAAAHGWTGSGAVYREPTLTVYCPDLPVGAAETDTRPTVVICPGGAYQFTSGREGEPVALRFNALGYNVFVLDYSVAPERYPAALLELAASVAYVRKNAARYHADPGRIAVAGFSAGGHLAASLGTLWKEPVLSGTLGLDAGLFRPDALILAYPVLSAGTFTHRESLENLTGEDEAAWAPLSLENRVTSDTPPAFLWHTFPDPAVPVENSLLFADALRKNGVPFELHIFPTGGHGLSLCDEETACGNAEQVMPHNAAWLPLCAEWLRVVFPSPIVSPAR